MRNPEYSIYGAAKVDNEGNLDAGEDRFNEVRSLSRIMSVVILVYVLVSYNAHCTCVHEAITPI